MTSDNVANLKFISYLVDSVNYKTNDNFVSNSDEKFDVDFDIESTIIINHDESIVQLDAIVGEEENQDCPFLIEASIIGFFEFEGNLKEHKDFLVGNAVAILFPYLRSVISEMSVKSNVFPNYLLPTINVSKYLLDSERVKIIDET